MGEISRRSPVAYTDGYEETNTKAICHKCLDKHGLEIKLVPYVMQDGRRDDKYRRCPNCADVIRRSASRYLSQMGVLGHTEGTESHYEAVSVRRRVNRDDPREDLKQDIPKLGNRPDKDLEFLVNEGAIITSLSDSEIEEE